MNKTIWLQLTFALMLFVALCGSVTAGTSAIAVIVNDQAVDFTGARPEQIKGAVLIPIRGVFAAMGAVVSYDPASKTIEAKKGSTTVDLTDGSSSAIVNGSTQLIGQPAIIVGDSVLVPLRFVAQSLGAYVQWHADTSTVDIQTLDRHLQTLPRPQIVLDSSTGESQVIGQLTGIFTNTSQQQVTVRLNGQNTSVPIAQDTQVVLKQAGAIISADLQALEVGDQVKIRLAPDGSAKKIEADFGEIVGTLKSMTQQADGSYFLTLDDGITVTLAADASVTMAGRQIQITDIMPSERIKIRTSLNNQIGYALEVQTDGQSSSAGSAPAVTPAIFSFECTTKTPLRSGAVLRTTLYGTPGATAMFCIPNVAYDIPMVEQQRGVYSGTYVVPNTVNVNGAAVVGHLLCSSGEIPAVKQASDLLTIDNTPPEIVDASPSEGSHVSAARPEIYALIDDSNGVGIDQSSIHLSIDGVDVTRLSTVTSAFVTYQPARSLSAGHHMVSLSISDKLGNSGLRSWEFVSDVQPKSITSFTADRPAGPIVLKPSERLNLTLTGDSGGSAFASVGAITIPLIETKPGVYCGQLIALPGSSVTDAPVTAHFTDCTHRELTVNLAQELTIDAGSPRTPSIVTPVDGSIVGPSVRIEGSAAPGSTVNVRIDYITKAFGLFAVNGTAAQTQVIADGRGKWATDTMSLISPSIVENIHDTTFTVLATVQDALGQLSQPASIKVTEQQQ